MNQPLDKQSILDHYQGELARFSPKGIEQFQPVVFAATSQDKRVIDLVAQFNACDERGRVTLMRLATSMPKNDSVKEICK